MFRYRLAVLLGVVLALAGCGGPEGTFAPGRPAATTAAPSPSPVVTTVSPTPSPEPTLSRKQACQQAVEATADWIYVVSRFARDPALEDISKQELNDLVAKVRETLPYLPPATADHARELVYPLEQMVAVMETGENNTIRLEGGRDAVVEVMQGCRGKADLSGYKSDWDR